MLNLRVFLKKKCFFFIPALTPPPLPSPRKEKGKVKFQSHGKGPWALLSAQA